MLSCGLWTHIRTYTSLAHSVCDLLGSELGIRAHLKLTRPSHTGISADLFWWLFSEPLSHIPFIRVVRKINTSNISDGKITRGIRKSMNVTKMCLYGNPNPCCLSNRNYCSTQTTSTRFVRQLCHLSRPEANTSLTAFPPPPPASLT